MERETVAKTLGEGFRQLLDTLVPTGSELGFIEEQREDIKDCLDDRFGLYAFFLSGAFLNDTNLPGYSSLDYFASMDHDDMPDDSSAFLSMVGETLAERFPNAGVAVRSPTVEMSFGADGLDAGGDRILKVIPAKLIGRTEGGYRLYEVADGTGGWVKASPDAHSACIAEVDARLGGEFKSLIRFVKAWKYFRDVAISSYYLELRCVTYAASEQTIAYTIDLSSIWQSLWDDQFADVQDPKGIAGQVSARSAGADKREAISKLRTVLYHVGRAQEAMTAGKIEEAFWYWNRVFNGHFPAYG
jgi:hypothetical protein